MANNKIKVFKWIDKDSLILHESGTYKGTINWVGNIGRNIKFIYGDVEGYVKIVNNYPQEIDIEYNNKTYLIKKHSFKEGKLGVLFNSGGIYKKDIEKQKCDRLHEVIYNNSGIKIEIIEYVSESDITIRINDTYNREHITYRDFTKDIVTVFDRNICGVGYIGLGKYKPSYINDKGKITPTKTYDAWRSMIRICYGNLNNCKSYKYVDVCEEWHNFQNFAKWYEENYYEFRNEIMQVDKDILVHNNKVYSPDTCLIVPNRINAMFIKNKSKRGKYPIGVYKYGSKETPYTAQCSDIELGMQKRLGEFKTPEEAFYAYKTYKESYIKRKAEEYKNEIPNKLYEAMINYKVEITD